MSKKPTFVIDMRCPACNQPVHGGIDVPTTHCPPLVTRCKHCKASVRLVPASSPAMAPPHYHVVMSDSFPRGLPRGGVVIPGNVLKAARAPMGKCPCGAIAYTARMHTDEKGKETFVNYCDDCNTIYCNTIYDSLKSILDKVRSAPKVLRKLAAGWEIHPATTLSYLYERWADEHQYEPFEDYRRAFAATLPEGVLLFNMTQQPFAAIVDLPDGAQAKFVADRRGTRYAVSKIRLPLPDTTYHDWNVPYQHALVMLDNAPKLEVKIALKRAARASGIPSGIATAKFMEWAEKKLNEEPPRPFAPHVQEQLKAAPTGTAKGKPRRACDAIRALLKEGNKTNVEIAAALCKQFPKVTAGYVGWYRRHDSKK